MPHEPNSLFIVSKIILRKDPIMDLPSAHTLPQPCLWHGFDQGIFLVIEVLAQALLLVQT
jgi:hypothetical protein